MNSAIFARVQDAAADIFNVPRDHITPQSAPENIEGWDSVQYLNLILALEQTFQVRFLPEDVEGTNSIGDLAMVLQKKLEERGEL